MDYQRIYNEFIADRRKKEKTLTGYTEKHHIIPRSHGGDNSKKNIIKLTAQDHYFAHELLARIHGGGMWSALFLMSSYGTKSAQGVKVSRKQYEIARINFIEHQRMIMTGEGNHFFGKTHDSETIKKIIKNRAQVTGKDHHEYNHEVVYWQHLETGERIYATQNEFRKITGLCHKPVSMVFHGKRKSHKGWFCEKQNTRESAIDWGCKGIKHYKSDLNIYTFQHKDGRTFKGTRQDFYKSEHDVPESGVRAVVKGVNKTVNGWKLVSIENA